MLADLAHGAVALVSVSRGIGVELRRVPAMSACHLIVGGGIGNVRVIIFVGSHDGRQPRLENQRMGGDDQSLSGGDRGSREVSTLARESGRCV